MMFLWFPFLILVPFVIFWMMGSHAGAVGCCGMHHLPNDPGTVPHESTALEIAQKRLARGEITPAEYEDIRSRIAG